MNDIEILEKYNSILNNAKANWIYEDYEILLNFKELYDKEKAKNKRYLKYLENKDNHYESVLEYLESEKEKDYIAKSKIKEKIEEVDNYGDTKSVSPPYYITKKGAEIFKADAELILEELLEEEDK